jgi:hypothetical protein
VACVTDLVCSLTVPVWSESGVETQVVDAPAWADIDKAIRALDGHVRSEVYLHQDRDDAETYMAIAGGSRNRYLVFVCHDNKRYDEAVTPDAADKTVNLVTGGQTGEFRLRSLVTLNEALEAARVYHQSGQLAGGVVWRHR